MGRSLAALLLRLIIWARQDRAGDHTAGQRRHDQAGLRGAQMKNKLYVQRVIGADRHQRAHGERPHQNGAHDGAVLEDAGRDQRRARKTQAQGRTAPRNTPDKAKAVQRGTPMMSSPRVLMPSNKVAEAAAMTTKPSQSMRWAGRSAAASSGRATTTHRATAPTGRLTQKIDAQPKWFGQHAAEDRPADAGRGKDGGEHALDTAAFLQTHDVGNDRLNQRHQAAATQAHGWPAPRSARTCGRQAAQQRAGEE